MTSRMRKQVYRALKSAAITYVPIILMELTRRGVERRKARTSAPRTMRARPDAPAANGKRHEPAAARTTTEAINSYLTDMLALEQHIEVAIRAQVADFENGPRILASTFEQVQLTVQDHIWALKELVEDRDAGVGNKVAEAVKRVGAVLSGAGAAAVDLVRHEKLPKDLRDDYTAFSLATASYVMLLSTAKSLGDRDVSQLAERHLREYTRVVMTLNHILPSAVIALLQEEGLPANEDALPGIASVVQDAWGNPDGDLPDIDEVSGA